MRDNFKMPNGWSETTFGAIVTTVSVNDKKLPRGEYLDEGLFPVVDQGQQFIGGYSNDETKVISEDLPVLVFGDHTRAFKYLDQPFVAGADGIKVLKPIGVDAKWLYQIAHALEFPDKGYARHYQHLKAAQIFVPPLPEQRRIVAEIEKQFSRLEEGVSALKRVQSNLKRYRAAVLKAACEGQLVENEVKSQKRKVKNVETGEQLLKRILEERRKKWQGRGKYKEPTAPDTTNLPSNLPKAWACASVDQITENFDGRRIPLKSADRDKRSGLYPYYGASGIIDDIDDFLFDGDYLLIAEDGANLLSRSTPIAFKATGKFWVNNHAHIVQTRGGIPLAYLSFFLNGKDISFSVTGSAQPKLTQAALNKIPIPLPPLAEQKRIVEEVERRLSVVEELESLVTTNLQRATRLRQSILQKAFEGEL